MRERPARPRRGGSRLPEARSNSTSVQPAAARTASRAAADSGARPRLVCTRTPVALITGVKVAAVGGSAAAAASATLAGLMAPERARSWARATAALTSAAPSSSRAATRRGSASTTSVLGTWRRGSTIATLRRRSRPCPEPSPRGGGRESNPPTTRAPSTGFEDRGGHQAPGRLRADVTRARAAPAIRSSGARPAG